MRRSYPHLRRDLLFAEDADGIAQIDLLNLIRQAGKFAAWRPAVHTGHVCEVTMLIAVQANGPTALLPGAHVVPEIVGSRRADHELSVPIVRDHGHERFNVQFA